jgi:hypothetical protein
MDFIGIISITFVIGAFLGFIFQRSQFCMTLILTESVVLKNHRRMIGLVGAIFFSIIFFNIAAFYGLIDMFNILGDIGVNPKFFEAPLVIEQSLIGGFIFGFGMILAGGCVAGVLFRIGEGQLSSVIAFIGIMTGFAGAFVLEAFHILGSNMSVYPSGMLLPEILNVNPIIFVTLAALFLLSIILCLHYNVGWKFVPILLIFILIIGLL